MEAARLVGVLGGAPDADHHLGAGHEGGEEIAAREAALLRDREAGREQDRARMHAGAGLGEVVELEGVRQRPIGEGGRRRLHQRSAEPEDAALAARTRAPRMRHDDLAPRQVVAEHDRSDRVVMVSLARCDDIGGHVLVAQLRGIFGEPQGLMGHGVNLGFAGV